MNNCHAFGNWVPTNCMHAVSLKVLIWLRGRHNIHWSWPRSESTKPRDHYWIGLIAWYWQAFLGTFLEGVVGPALRYYESFGLSFQFCFQNVAQFFSKSLSLLKILLNSSWRLSLEMPKVSQKVTKTQFLPIVWSQKHLNLTSFVSFDGSNPPVGWVFR